MWSPWPRIAPAATAREDVHLVAVDQAIGLPFDHDAIVTKAVTALRDRYREHPDPDRLLPSPFTLHELRACTKPCWARLCPRTPSVDTCSPNSAPPPATAKGVVGKPALLFRHPRTRT